MEESDRLESRYIAASHQFVRFVIFGIFQTSKFPSIVSKVFKKKLLMNDILKIFPDTRRKKRDAFSLELLKHRDPFLFLYHNVIIRVENVENFVSNEIFEQI